MAQLRAWNYCCRSTAANTRAVSTIVHVNVNKKTGKIYYCTLHKEDMHYKCKTMYMLFRLQ